MISAKTESYVRILAGAIWRRAFEVPPIDGNLNAETMHRIRLCTLDDDVTGLRVMFTRDTGHHTSGWMKNPDFERCLHLSISPARLVKNATRIGMGDGSRALVNLWVRSILKDGERLALYESAKTPEGKAHEVEHWRVFCDPVWTPFKPRGEVYASDNTPVDWKSWTEVAGRSIVSPLDPT
jgi:hypothetical protein